MTNNSPFLGTPIEEHEENYKLLTVPHGIVNAGLPMLYRYNASVDVCVDGSEFIYIYLNIFPVISILPATYLIEDPSGDKKYVLRDPNGKRYAYEQKSDAWNSFLRRVERKVMHTKRDYGNAVVVNDLVKNIKEPLT